MNITVLSKELILSKELKEEQKRQVVKSYKRLYLIKLLRNYDLLDLIFIFEKIIFERCLECYGPVVITALGLPLGYFEYEQATCMECVKTCILCNEQYPKSAIGITIYEGVCKDCRICEDCGAVKWDYVCKCEI